jgi:hypothetical protein
MQFSSNLSDVARRTEPAEGIIVIDRERPDPALLLAIQNSPSRA